MISLKFKKGKVIGQEVTGILKRQYHCAFYKVVCHFALYEHS